VADVVGALAGWPRKPCQRIADAGGRGIEAQTLPSAVLPSRDGAAAIAAWSPEPVVADANLSAGGSIHAHVGAILSCISCFASIAPRSVEVPEARAVGHVDRALTVATAVTRRVTPGLRPRPPRRALTRAITEARVVADPVVVAVPTPKALNRAVLPCESSIALAPPGRLDAKTVTGPPARSHRATVTGCVTIGAAPSKVAIAGPVAALAVVALPLHALASELTVRPPQVRART
jgi:hypothetical protein